MTHPILAVLFTGALVLCAALLLLRFVLGPTVMDRLVAFEAVTLASVCLAAVWAATLGTLWLYDVILVISLVGFLATVSIAIFVERREMEHD
jgi:multicomponent Na+:H+ antiporter subunit F